jgi:hypothetical protein
MNKLENLVIKLDQLKNQSPFCYGFIVGAIDNGITTKELPQLITKSAGLGEPILAIWEDAFDKLADSPGSGTDFSLGKLNQVQTPKDFYQAYGEKLQAPKAIPQPQPQPQVQQGQQHPYYNPYGNPYSNPYSDPNYGRSSPGSYANYRGGSYSNQVPQDKYPMPYRNDVPDGYSGPQKNMRPVYNQGGAEKLLPNFQNGDPARVQEWLRGLSAEQRGHLRQDLTGQMKTLHNRNRPTYSSTFSDAVYNPELNLFGDNQNAEEAAKHYQAYNAYRRAYSELHHGEGSSYGAHGQYDFTDKNGKMTKVPARDYLAKSLGYDPIEDLYNKHSKFDPDSTLNAITPMVKGTPQQRRAFLADTDYATFRNREIQHIKMLEEQEIYQEEQKLQKELAVVQAELDKQGAKRQAGLGDINPGKLQAIKAKHYKMRDQIPSSDNYYQSRNDILAHEDEATRFTHYRGKGDQYGIMGESGHEIKPEEDSGHGSLSQNLKRKHYIDPITGREYAASSYYGHELPFYMRNNPNMVVRKNSKGVPVLSYNQYEAYQDTHDQTKTSRYLYDRYLRGGHDHKQYGRGPGYSADDRFASENTAEAFTTGWANLSPDQQAQATDRMSLTQRQFLTDSLYKLSQRQLASGDRTAAIKTDETMRFINNRIQSQMDEAKKIPGFDKLVAYAKTPNAAKYGYKDYEEILKKLPVPVRNVIYNYASQEYLSKWKPPELPAYQPALGAKWIDRSVANAAHFISPAQRTFARGLGINEDIWGELGAIKKIQQGDFSQPLGYGSPGQNIWTPREENDPRRLSYDTGDVLRDAAETALMFLPGGSGGKVLGVAGKGMRGLGSRVLPISARAAGRQAESGIRKGLLGGLSVASGAIPSGIAGSLGASEEVETALGIGGSLAGYETFGKAIPKVSSTMARNTAKASKLSNEMADIENKLGRLPTGTNNPKVEAQRVLLMKRHEALKFQQAKLTQEAAKIKTAGGQPLAEAEMEFNQAEQEFAAANQAQGMSPTDKYRAIEAAKLKRARAQAKMDKIYDDLDQQFLAKKGPTNQAALGKPNIQDPLTSPEMSTTRPQIPTPEPVGTDAQLQRLRNDIEAKTKEVRSLEEAAHNAYNTPSTDPRVPARASNAARKAQEELQQMQIAHKKLQEALPDEVMMPTRRTVPASGQQPAVANPGETLTEQYERMHAEIKAKHNEIGNLTDRANEVAKTGTPEEIRAARQAVENARKEVELLHDKRHELYQQYKAQGQTPTTQTPNQLNQTPRASTPAPDAPQLPQTAPPSTGNVPSPSTPAPNLPTPTPKKTVEQLHVERNNLNKQLGEKMLEQQQHRARNPGAPTPPELLAEIDNLGGQLHTTDFEINKLNRANKAPWYRLDRQLVERAYPYFKEHINPFTATQWSDPELYALKTHAPSYTGNPDAPVSLLNLKQLSPAAWMDYATAKLTPWRFIGTKHKGPIASIGRYLSTRGAQVGGGLAYDYLKEQNQDRLDNFSPAISKGLDILQASQAFTSPFSGSQRWFFGPSQWYRDNLRAMAADNKEGLTESQMKERALKQMWMAPTGGPAGFNALNKFLDADIDVSKVWDKAQNIGPALRNVGRIVTRERTLEQFKGLSDEEKLRALGYENADDEVKQHILEQIPGRIDEVERGMKEYQLSPTSGVDRLAHTFNEGRKHAKEQKQMMLLGHMVHSSKNAQAHQLYNDWNKHQARADVLTRLQNKEQVSEAEYANDPELKQMVADQKNWDRHILTSNNAAQAYGAKLMPILKKEFKNDPFFSEIENRHHLYNRKELAAALSDPEHPLWDKIKQSKFANKNIDRYNYIPKQVLAQLNDAKYEQAQEYAKAYERHTYLQKLKNDPDQYAQLTDEQKLQVDQELAELQQGMANHPTAKQLADRKMTIEQYKESLLAGKKLYSTDYSHLMPRTVTGGRIPQANPQYSNDVASSVGSARDRFPSYPANPDVSNQLPPEMPQQLESEEVAPDQSLYGRIRARSQVQPPEPTQVGPTKQTPPPALPDEAPLAGQDALGKGGLPQSAQGKGGITPTSQPADYSSALDKQLAAQQAQLAQTQNPNDKKAIQAKIQQTQALKHYVNNSTFKAQAKMQQAGVDPSKPDQVISHLNKPEVRIEAAKQLLHDPTFKDKFKDLDPEEALQVSLSIWDRMSPTHKYFLYGGLGVAALGLIGSFMSGGDDEEEIDENGKRVRKPASPGMLSRWGPLLGLGGLGAAAYGATGGRPSSIIKPRFWKGLTGSKADTAA